MTYTIFAKGFLTREHCQEADKAIHSGMIEAAYDDMISFHDLNREDISAAREIMESFGFEVLPEVFEEHCEGCICDLVEVETKDDDSSTQEPEEQNQETTTTEEKENGTMTDRYDYLEAVTEDVKQYIKDEIDMEEWKDDRDGLEEYLNDHCWISDSVTGNASGSYYCNTWRAEEALAHNLDLIAEVAAEFGCEPTISDGYEHGAEWWDVTIRCYYLGQAIAEALDELESEGAFDEADEAETAGSLDTIRDRMIDGFNGIAAAVTNTETAPEVVTA